MGRRRSVMSNERESPIAALAVERLDVDGEASSGFARIAFWLVVAYLVASRLIADIYTLPIGVSLHLTDVIPHCVAHGLAAVEGDNSPAVPNGRGLRVWRCIDSGVSHCAASKCDKSVDVRIRRGSARGGPSHPLCRFVRRVLSPGVVAPSGHSALDCRCSLPVFQSLVVMYEVATKEALLILGSM